VDWAVLRRTDEPVEHGWRIGSWGIRT
jgi:hypothetical protein